MRKIDFDGWFLRVLCGCFIWCVGSVELAAIGVSVSVFNLVSKLFNVPLLNVTTSFVAEEQTLINQRNADSGQSVDGNGIELLV